MECHVITRAGRFDLDISMAAIPDNGWLGVVGRSGAGKSTFLQALAGMDKSASVSGRWGDYDFNKPENVILVSHQTPLFPALSVIENIKLVAHYNQQADNTEAVISLCECETLLAKTPAELSGGELQRVKLCRSILANPSLLLLDECVSAMDIALRRRILLRLKNYLSSAVKVVMVSHDIADIMLTCEQLALVENGRCVKSGPLQELVGMTHRCQSDILPLGNIIKGVVSEYHSPVARLTIGVHSVTAVTQQPIAVGQEATLFIRASDVLLSKLNQQVIQTNCLPGVVTDKAPYSNDRQCIVIDCDSQQFVTLLDRTSPCAPDIGEKVLIHFSAQHILA